MDQFYYFISMLLQFVINFYDFIYLIPKILRYFLYYYLSIYYFLYFYDTFSVIIWFISFIFMILSSLWSDLFPYFSYFLCHYISIISQLFLILSLTLHLYSFPTFTNIYPFITSLYHLPTFYHTYTKFSVNFWGTGHSMFTSQPSKMKCVQSLTRASTILSTESLLARISRCSLHPLWFSVMMVPFHVEKRIKFQESKVGGFG